MQSGDQAFELFARTRPWQGGLPKVIIEIVVVNPDWMVGLNWRKGELALGERDKMQPAPEMVAKRRENVSVGRIEDGEPRNMHRGFRRFSVQEAGIEG